MLKNKIVHFIILIIILSSLDSIYISYTIGIKSSSEISILKYITTLLYFLFSSYLFYITLRKNKIPNKFILDVLLIFYLTVIILVNLFYKNYTVLYLIRVLSSMLIIFSAFNGFSGLINPKYLKYFFFIHFIVQLIQAFLFNNLQGLSNLGLNLRNTGLLVMPSTAGLISVLSLIYLLANNKRNYFLIIVTIISVLLTASGLSLVILFLSFFIIFNIKRSVFLILSGFLVPLFLIFAPIILGRANLFKSISDRLYVWSKLIEKMQFLNLSTSGYYTNSFASASRISGNSSWRDYIIDGDFFMISLNFGVIIFIIYIASILIKTISSNRSIFYLGIIFTCVSFTVNLLEIPFAILLFACLITKYENKIPFNRNSTSS
jgi:hypothetical protein